jgi:hypothetical protein
MHPVVSDPTDYKGMPAVTQQDGMTIAHFLPFGDLQAMITATGPLIVFLDDIGQSTPAVQAALMQLLLSRRVNGHKISDHVVFVAASNRRQDKSGVTGMLDALIDRFTCVVTMEFSIDDWDSWAYEHGVAPELRAFARFRKDLIAEREPNRDMRKTPSPRSVAGLGRLYNAGVRQTEALSGAAGEGFCAEFLAFVEVWGQIPTFQEVVANPKKVPVFEEPARQYAMVMTLAQDVDAETFKPVLVYMERMAPEFQVLFARDAIRRDKTIEQVPAFREWLLENADLLGGTDPD